MDNVAVGVLLDPVCGDQGQQDRVWTPEIPRACLICFRWHRHNISNERPHQVLCRGLLTEVVQKCSS